MKGVNFDLIISEELNENTDENHYEDSDEDEDDYSSEDGMIHHFSCLSDAYLGLKFRM